MQPAFRSGVKAQHQRSYDNGAEIRAQWQRRAHTKTGSRLARYISVVYIKTRKKDNTQTKNRSGKSSVKNM